MESEESQADVIIIGGGITGLWLLNLLCDGGYSTLLIEKDALGAGQTLASQGMIHGGIKYTLAGTTTGASETIKDMPSRWLNCLAGTGTLDLRSVRLLSRDYYLFSDASLTSRVTAFFGSKAIEGRVQAVDRRDYPVVFQSPAFKGALYRLQDVVIDTESLLAVLASRYADRIVKGNPTVKPGDTGIRAIEVAGRTLTAAQYILAAGEGNGKLMQQLDLHIGMQLRPLHQSVVTGDLPPLYAHAVSLAAGDRPRMTITTHPAAQGNTWYIGGQLAETGVSRTEAEQIAFTRSELGEVFPWLDFSACAFSTLRVNRAEPSQQDAGRPDTPFVGTGGNVFVCWPTKLTLVPLLGDELAARLPAPSASCTIPSALPRAEVGSLPWS